MSTLTLLPYVLTDNLRQALGARIDEWDTHDLFAAEGSKGLLWLILGLSQSPSHISDAEKVYQCASGTSFHRMASVFWVHMVFDMLAAQAELEFGSPRRVVPNPDQLTFLQKKEGIKSVCSSANDIPLRRSSHTTFQLLLWLSKWPTNLNKLFAEPPALPAPGWLTAPASDPVPHPEPADRRSSLPLDSLHSIDSQPSAPSAPVPQDVPRPEQVHQRSFLPSDSPRSAHSQPSTSSPPVASPSENNQAVTSYTTSSRFLLEAAAQTKTSALLRRMPLNLAASAEVQSVIFEDIATRDRSMRHPHVINNLAMAGAVLSYLVTVRSDHLRTYLSRSHICSNSRT